MTTLDSSFQNAHLAQLIADIDELLSPAPGCEVALEELGVDRCVTRVRQRLTECVRSQTRLVTEVRKVRSGLGDPVQSCGGPSLANQSVVLPVAVLGIPVRTTKRDYNYFDALNADLKELRARQHARHAPRVSKG